MIDDTIITGKSRFPQTQWSAIVATGSAREDERQRAYDTIVAAYWRPVYAYIRIKWHKSRDDAKDLTQSFFLKAIEKNYFSNYDPAKALFRTYLRTCLEGFLANANKAAKRLKRGGEAIFQSLDFERADGELQVLEIKDDETPEAYFDKEWLRGFFDLAVTELRRELQAEGKDVHIRLFERYDLAEGSKEHKVSYDSLAREFDLPTTTVNNYLAAARRRLRRIVLQKLRELTASEEEFRQEARAVLGTSP